MAIEYRPTKKFTATTGARPNEIVVAGELDLHTQPIFVAAIDEARGGGETALEIDMSAVEFMDSAGINTLVRAYKAPPFGGIRVVNPSPVVLRLLEVTSLRDLFLAD